MAFNISRTLLELDLSKAYLDLMERELVLLEVCQRKYQIGESTGVLIQVEHVGAFHHSDAGNPCAQGGSTPGGMELDNFQEGFCLRM
ncbi:hypothetical protein CMV_014291 [Castanea mollissima]|uniref:Uncharacterized protein n=1 Tax=Castanea mollissima TaxID=60419 RepID=A0A8J4RBW7_9ROSI|nr:hypothetical protein CMV_014291 [Castanea mollissima]